MHKIPKQKIAKFIYFDNSARGRRPRAAKKCLPRVCPWEVFRSVYNSQPGGFEPVYSTCRANRLLGAGRQTLSHCWELPLSPSHTQYPFCIHARDSLFVGEEASLLTHSLYHTFGDLSSTFLKKELGIEPIRHSLPLYRRHDFATIEKLFLFCGGNGEARPSKSRVRAELHRLTAFPKSLAVPIPLAFAFLRMELVFGGNAHETTW
jgi:hypothetical protein